MSIVNQRIWSGAVTAATTGVGAAGAVASTKNTRSPLGVVGKVVGAVIDVTATSGTTPTLDVKIQGTGGESPARWADLITFTQKTTSTGTERKGLNTAWCDILNPSGKNPVAVDVPSFLRVDFATGGTNPSYTCTIDLLVQIED